MSLFRNISGKSEEDISTEIISYMLGPTKEFVPFQKLFFNRIIKRLDYSSALDVEVVTQASFSGSGKPDFIVLTNDALILGETKLGSYLSGDDQLIKYKNILLDNKRLQNYFFSRDLDSVHTRIMVFIAPKTTIELSIKICDQVCEKKYGTNFLAYLRNDNIDFVPIAWEDLLTDLDTSNPIQNEFFLLVTNFINQELTKEEKMVLVNEKVPEALNKLFKTIDACKSHLSTKAYTVERMGQSFSFYGFTIVGRNLKCWFGYILPLWAEYKTPIFLQVQESWIRAEKEAIVEKLRKDGFSQKKDHGYIKPFPIDVIGTWKQDLVSILDKILDDRG